MRWSILTSQTCGEPCWHAREEICRCSCGGKNHGCLLVHGGETPERTAKIDGHRYRLAAVGLSRDLLGEANRINGQQWRAMEPAEMVIGSSSRNENGQRWSAADGEKARAAGRKVWFSQYYYSWRETDAGAPARMKTASADQLARWTELRGWQEKAKDRIESIYLLWTRTEMPGAPEIKRVNGETGEPLANQSPLGEQV